MQYATTPDAIIARELGVNPAHVTAVINLLADGATIPFISRYRKEATGNMDEVAIFRIEQRAAELAELEKRRAYILETIRSQEKLTPELEERILATLDPSELEDIYLPYKPKRRTRAQMAREAGLEPLAKIIMAQRTPEVGRAAAKFTGEKVATADEAIKGARDIIAEWVNESEAARSRVRDQFRRFAVISSKAVKLSLIHI